MNKFIGDRKFYKMVLTIAVPIMIQNGITNFVGLLDNIMVGQLGTEQMSGVAIVNQLIFVFNLCIFGGMSASSIFGAQYYGQGNHKGLRNAFRFKIITSAVITFIGITVFLLFGRDLISSFLHEGSQTGDINLALDSGMRFLKIMLIGLVPFSINQAYTGTLRETGETVVPMKAGILAVFLNLVFDYVLIYGKFGAPALGVEGAAYATIIARFVECGVIIYWTHSHSAKNIFIQNAYSSFHIPIDLVKGTIIKGSPLLINELLWSSGMAFLMQCYSLRGLSVVAGYNISATISNLFNIVFIALGSAVAIIVGQLLGAGKLEEAMTTAIRLIFFSTACCIIVGCIMALLAPFIPLIYKTNDEVKYLATRFIRISALMMPIQAFLHATYFTIRSGGKTIVTFFFDSFYMWVICIPLAYCLSRFTVLPVLLVYFICQSTDIVKCIIGFTLVRKGIWLQNIVAENK